MKIAQPASDGVIDVLVNPAGLAARPRLFGALEAAFAVTFRPRTPGTTAAAAIEIADHGAPRSAAELGRPPIPTLLIGGPVSGEVSDVQLRDAPQLDRRLWDVHLPAQSSAAGLEAVGAGETVLAADRVGPRWAVSGDGMRTHRVAAALPELPGACVLRDAVFSPHGLAVIALIQFLREVGASAGWQAPPLRAALVFDDPNLRWRRYGFIDYRDLVAHADRHGYHAVMAMVPADVYGTHRATAALFRARADRLSLVMHGNNHVKRELMLPRTYAEALAVCAQALRRITAFEARTGVPVDRVMMPPHGMCAESATRALGALGFDALCALHPVPWTEQPATDHVLAGWDPATFAAGCAVIPRFPLTVSGTGIALRAFLDHPLVLYGHHADLADGLAPLAEAARRVNRLGEVEWTSLARIAAGNHAVRTDGEKLWIRPFAGRVRVRVPERGRALIVQRPREARADLLGWSDGRRPVRFGDPVEVRPGELAEIRLRPSSAADPCGVAAPAWTPWPAIRRVATEARDRAMPLGLAR